MKEQMSRPREVVGLDLAEMYPVFSRRLERIVAIEVHAPEAVIEEACQVAWSRLAQHAHAVARDKAPSWLITTARREVLRSLARAGRECSLEAVLEERGDGAAAPRTWAQPGVVELVEQRERLRCVGELPRRQQRVLMLHAVGYSYAEISAVTGDSARTVERQLLRARGGVRALAA